MRNETSLFDVILHLKERLEQTSTMDLFDFTPH